MVFPADPVAVRQALCALFTGWTPGPIGSEARDAAQIVLAEALNNIVEHAYALGPGEIEVTVEATQGGVTCQIIDAGVPLPGGALPDGRLPSPAAAEDLSEGGYGWHLIRSLAEDLCYRREGGRNLLSFRISAQQSPE